MDAKNYVMSTALFGCFVSFWFFVYPCSTRHQLHKESKQNWDGVSEDKQESSKFKEVGSSSSN